MPFKVQVGPHQVSIHHGQTVLVSEPDGQINGRARRVSISLIRASSAVGLFTPMASRGIFSTAVRSPTMPREPISPIGVFAPPDGVIPERTLGLVIRRLISGGMHEDLDVTNNSMQRVSFQLEIALRCDFADIFEVKSNNIVRRGQIATEWSQTKQQLRTSYHNGDFVRAVRWCSAASGRPNATYANGRLSFEIVLDPGEAWHCCLLYTLEDGEQVLSRRRTSAPTNIKKLHAETLSDWLRPC